jgi:hypothetical protein
VNAKFGHLLLYRSLSLLPLQRSTVLCLSFDHRNPNFDIAHSELRIKDLAAWFKEIRSTSGRASRLVARLPKPLRPDRIDRVAEERLAFVRAIFVVQYVRKKSICKPGAWMGQQHAARRDAPDASVWSFLHGSNCSCENPRRSALLDSCRGKFPSANSVRLVPSRPD